MSSLKFLSITLLWVWYTQTLVAQSTDFFVNNTSAIEAVEDPVIVTKEQIKSWMGGKLPSKIPVVFTKGVAIPCQTDDLDKNGEWDELVFMVTLKAGEKQKFQLKFLEPQKVPQFGPRTNVRFGVNFDHLDKSKPVTYRNVTSEVRPLDWKPQQQPPRYQMEGPGWENDKVAFRNYFDSRNGMDIFGKTTSAMVLDNVDGTIQDYHKMCDWGMDILKVGNSLGAGGISFYHNGTFKHLKHTGMVKYDLIVKGPVRSIIQITYDNWQVGDKSYKLTQRFSIYAGKYWYRNDYTLMGVDGEVQLATGIVNLKNTKPAITQTNNQAYLSLLTHDKQSENDDMLGMAVVGRVADFQGYGVATGTADDEASATNTLIMKVRDGQTNHYYFFAGWEKSNPEFSNQKGFAAYVQREADRFANALIVSKK
jgi:hypothetical protein